MSETTVEKSENRRGADRKRTLKKAIIAFNDRYSTMQCVVRNQSKGGAFLQLAENHIIPNVVELKIQPSQDYKPAEVIWRSHEAVGIRFMDVEMPQAPEKPADAELIYDTLDEERRVSKRTKTLKKADIAFNSRYSSMTCQVRDESPIGLRLKVTENHVIPNDIEVKVAPSNEFKPAEVIWRGDDVIGVKLVKI